MEGKDWPRDKYLGMYKVWKATEQDETTKKIVADREQV